jgi:zinc D-Ala-D-Ala carboxypeptidase
MISLKETDCSDGCGLNITPKLLTLLNEFRKAYGKPMTVSSGARCLAVNLKAGGKTRSAHMDGLAVDFVRTPELAAFCTVENLTKYGLYMEHLSATPTWIHLSSRPPKSGNRIFKP